MARLTTEDGYLVGHENKTCRNICDRAVFCYDCPISKALKKLAEYESTGLTPEEVREQNGLL